MLSRVKRAVQGRSARVEQGVDKAANAIDKRTSGKYDDKIAKGADAVNNQARCMDLDRPNDPPTAGGTFPMP